MSKKSLPHFETQRTSCHPLKKQNKEIVPCWNSMHHSLNWFNYRCSIALDCFGVYKSHVIRMLEIQVRRFFRIGVSSTNWKNGKKPKKPTPPWRFLRCSARKEPSPDPKLPTMNVIPSHTLTLQWFNLFHSERPGKTTLIFQVKLRHSDIPCPSFPATERCGWRSYNHSQPL